MKRTIPTQLRVGRSGLYAALCGLALTGFSAYAQTDSEEDSDDVYELSPFTIDGSKDQGYQATNTLSGNRLNTENRFVGASVTEVTKQLLEDLNIDDFEDVLNYVPNSAPAESGGLSSDPTGNESIFGVRYRVRGFLLTGFSRDFFKTRVAPDSYNTQRMSFSRGPNSVLFGIAEPGGVTNAVSTRASFEDTNRVGMRFDTWDSTRFHASLNRELIDDKLAVRFSTVYDDHRNHRNPWHNRSDRYYGAVTYKPFEKTTLRAQHEWGDAERYNVRSWAPSDGISVWEAAGSPALPEDLYNITTAGDRITPAERTALGMAEFWPAAHTVMTVGDVDQTGFHAGRWAIRTAENLVPGYGQGQNGTVSFTDDSVIPMTANVLGNGNRNMQEFSNTSLFFEQKLMENLFFEVAYNRQDTNNSPNFATGSRDTVYKDIKPTIRTVDPNNPRTETGIEITNPNFGKYFTFNNTPVTFNQNYDDETLRAMVSYELDLRERFEGKLGTILGRHSLAAMYETYDEGYLNQVYHHRNAMRRPDLKPGQGLWVALQNYIDIENQVFDVPDIAHMAPRVWAENAEDLPGSDPSGVAPFWFGVAGTNTFSETTSEMFAMQNYFWDNKIVTTFGWRSDDVDSWNVNAAVDPDTLLRSNVSLVDPKTGATSSVSAGGDTNSKGIVITPIPWLGFFYNESSNFRPSNADQVNIFGEGLGNEAGEGEDYGLKFYLMDGKVTGSLAYFETTFQNQSTRGPRAGPVGSFDQSRVASRAAIEEYYEDVVMQPELAEIWDTRGYLNNDTYYNTQDFSSEGWELSLTANPTPNWRMTFNLSKQENVSSNVAPALKEWAKFIRTAFDDFPELKALETTLLSSDGVTYNTVADNLDVHDQRIVEISSLEGFADQRQPEMSANFLTAYDFKEGALKNFGVGASFRWRDSAAVGYQLQDNGSGALDATRPYMNDSTEWLGVFASYRMKFEGGTRMRLQLNIDNLLDDESLNPLLSREVNGQRFDSRWVLPEGRSIAMSATFDF
ncbi:TonB-dependent receptor plug domain-containing protein [Pelagicoccus mobilis]|uniref:TonB-dependent receptor plug domain-containing protein n=1 Tax=Pelagicoccus mobilis TaxID=415221 RepID=A0A934RYU1_9BACT|nr:TonB-dependent receptor plug domain-containing protein [Pelagicoccus mobilis]MBK1876018.1 TonB-dependent receptor plug domain-containing protein [Pelagicoccus mobilis]